MHVCEWDRPSSKNWSGLVWSGDWDWDWDTELGCFALMACYITGSFILCGCVCVCVLL